MHLADSDIRQSACTLGVWLFREDLMNSPKLFTVCVIALVCAVVFAVACGGGSGATTTSKGSALPATVTVTLSDPPTCSTASGGDFRHVFVTISDVQIHTSATAQASDPGWISLTPDLKNSPQQVDLFGLAGNGCFLAQLGSKTNIPPGTYQQIRIFLASTSMTLSSNSCLTGINCVVTADGAYHVLDLSSEVQTGIKIPSGQIAGGNFTIAGGENKGLNIDFDGCRSLVVQGNSGRFRLKPVLHAGEVGLNSNSITGKLVTAVTNAPLANVKAIVALEQKDANGVDRVVMQTTTDANGSFILCPVAAGTYDVVAVAIISSGPNANTAFATTITTGVQPGAALGNVPMIPQIGLGTGQASITGLVSTAAAAGSTTADLQLSALQQTQLNGTNVQVTIPLVQQQSSTLTVTTVVDATCAAKTACVTYTLAVPAQQPSVGAFATAGTVYSQSLATPVTYTVDAQAFVPGSSSTPTCTPPELTTNTLKAGGPLAVTAGQTSTASDINFTGCQ